MSMAVNSVFSWSDTESPIILSHGGGVAFARANSLEAMRASAAMGIRAVELDVHELADGTFVLYHHWLLPDNIHWVADSTSEAFQEALGPAYLELSNAFTEAKKHNLGIYLDIKGMTLEGQQKLWKMIDVLFDRRSIVLASFQVDIAVRAAEAGYQASIPFRDRWMDPKRMAQTPIKFLHPVLDDGHGFEKLTTEYISRVHEQGKRVISWLTNDPDEMSVFLERGCDIILTDDPRIATNVIGSLHTQL
jgi:glycerophosphoryl diester phosphodiesterase